MKKIQYKIITQVFQEQCCYLKIENQKKRNCLESNVFPHVK